MKTIVQKTLPFLVLAVLAAGACSLIGCKKKPESLGEKLEDKVNDALDRRPGEKIRDAVEDVSDAVKEAKEDVKDALK